MTAIEVDVAIIGSGVAALRALYTARQLNKLAIAVDASYTDGGYLQVIDGSIPKAPLFLTKDSIKLFEKLGIEVECFDVELKVVKEGDYNAKALGFTYIDIQRNWFSEWLNQSSLCFGLDIFNRLKMSLGFPRDKHIHLQSSIRRIDVRRRVITLTTGDIIRFRRLVYTWPLELLPKYVFPMDERTKIEELVRSMGVDYVSVYILTVLLSKESRGLNPIEIYTHATKASRMHTAISVSIKDLRLVYAITSYSKSYPLLPGIQEKLLSELRKHRIAQPINIIKDYGVNIVYGLINKVDVNMMKKLDEVLNKVDIYLFGRLAQWRDLSVVELLEEENNIVKAVE